MSSKDNGNDEEVIPDKVSEVEIEVADVVVIGAAHVVDVDVHLQLNQIPLLNCEYKRTLVSSS